MFIPPTLTTNKHVRLALRSALLFILGVSLFYPVHPVDEYSAQALCRSLLYQYVHYKHREQQIVCFSDDSGGASANGNLVLESEAVAA